MGSFYLHVSLKCGDWRVDHVINGGTFAFQTASPLQFQRRGQRSERCQRDEQALKR
jgi:hypothetical protein